MASQLKKCALRPANQLDLLGLRRGSRCRPEISHQEVGDDSGLVGNEQAAERGAGGVAKLWRLKIPLGVLPALPVDAEVAEKNCVES